MATSKIDRKAVAERFAENLRRLRAKAGLSQSAVSERSGLHWTEISKLEGGRVEPDLRTLICLAAALDPEAPGELVNALAEGMEWTPPEYGDPQRPNEPTKPGELVVSPAGTPAPTGS